MTTATLTLTEFLLARIAEDEAVARSLENGHDPLDWSGDWADAVGLHGPVDGPSGYESIVIDPARVLAECESKRRIVELHAHWEDSGYCSMCGDVPQVEHPCETLLQLAFPYADHPDYDEAWRP